MDSAGLCCFWSQILRQISKQGLRVATRDPGLKAGLAGYAARNASCEGSGGVRFVSRVQG